MGFTPERFSNEVKQCSGAEWIDPPEQVLYLATYLAHAEVGVRSMLVERPYVDRHYIQEFVGHYATMLRPVPPTATRIHFFQRKIDDAGWDALLEKAAVESKFEETERELNNHYLGYVVVRPVPRCPIGRTILRPFGGRPSRCYEPSATLNEVHLHGFTLRIPALPFQQQDQALGACATTALWSALSRVTRADGGRAVTPLDVARAVPGAHGHVVASPHGLDLEQMAATIRALGYAPHVLTLDDHDSFLLALKAYVRGGIPVVLRLRVEGGDVHAVTVAGLRFDDDDEPAKDIALSTSVGSASSKGLARLYLHDDRLGPYARHVLVHPSAKELKAASKGGYSPPLRIQFRPEKRGFEAYEKPMRIEHALVPLYPKIRLTAKHLVELAGQYLSYARGMAEPSNRHQLRVEPFYALGGSYLTRLGEVLKDPQRLAQCRRRAFLSRYVGVIRFFLADVWFFDIVVDTTDAQNQADGTPVLLMVANDLRQTANLKRLPTRGVLI